MVIVAIKDWLTTVFDWNGGSDLNEPTAIEIEAALRSVLDSKSFANTDRLKEILSHVVTETMVGNNDGLLGKNLANDIYGIDASETDDLSAVRVELGRLRRRLSRYYANEGKADPVIISIPKGAYVARFARREQSPRHERQGRISWRPMSGRLLPLIATTLIGILVLSILALEKEANTSILPRLTVTNFSSQLPETEALAQGLTTDLVNRLAKFRHNISVSRDDASFREPWEMTIGEERDFEKTDYRMSGYVLAGSEGPRLDVELVSYPSGEVVWVEEFGPPEDNHDLHTSQMEIAEIIARIVAGRRGQISRLELSNSETGAQRAAYRCVLRYHAYQAKRSAEAHKEIRHCLERASTTTPEYAEVWSSLAQIYLDELKSNFNPRPLLYDSLEKAHAAALKGVETGPESSTSYSVLAAVEYFRRDLDAFEAAGRKAIQFNPNDADVLSYFAHYLSLSGKWEEGQELQYKAMRMSPGHPPVWHSSSVLNALRKQDYQSALKHAELGFDPGYYISVLYLVAIHGHLGNRDAALDGLANLEKLRPKMREEITQDLSKRYYPQTVIRELQQGLELAYKMAARN